MNNTTYETHAPHIAHHYTHAKEKHPIFADYISTSCSVESAVSNLGLCRKLISSLKCTYADTLAHCEIAEVVYAYVRGDKEHAIDECYDAVAVLLRMADMIRAEIVE